AMPAAGMEARLLHRRAREQARREAAFVERPDDLADMAGIARLDDDIDLGELHRHVVEEALVIDLDDVAAALADDAGDAGEHSGRIADLGPEPHQAAVANEAAHHDR